MIDRKALKAELARRGKSQKEMARLLGMSEKTFISRMRSGDFWLHEIERMMEVLEISDPMPIFFHK